MLAGGAVVCGVVGDGHPQRRRGGRVVDVIAAVPARDQVGAAAADAPVLVVTAEKPVVVEPADELVRADHAREAVEPRAAVEIVVAGVAVERVVAAQAVELVAAGAAGEHVRGVVAGELVAGLAADEVLDRQRDVVALAAAAVVGDPVDRDENGRGAAGVGDRVVAAVTVHAVGPAATVDRVVAVGICGLEVAVADDRVGAAAAPEVVGAGATLDPRRQRRLRVDEVVVVVHLERERVQRDAWRDLGRAGDLDRGDPVTEVRERADRRAAGLGVEELAA